MRGIWQKQHLKLWNTCPLVLHSYLPHWGTPEHLEHGENVLLAHNNKEWTEHICSLILSKEKREQIGQNAYKTIVDKFSYSEVYKEIKNILLHE